MAPETGYIWMTCHSLWNRIEEAQKWQRGRKRYSAKIKEGETLGDTKTRDATMEKEGGDRRGVMEGRMGRNRDKAEQVLIGERLGSECQRYLLSQRRLMCEACLSRGPQRCEVIMGSREEDRDI